MKKWRTSTKIALAAAVLVVGSAVGYKVITDQMILTEKFPVLTPSEVNLVGLPPESGYRIVVANQMAQIVKIDGGFEAKDTDAGGATEGAIKKRLPIRELIGTLRGDARQLGKFIMILNDMSENEDWPTVRIVWTAEDLKKAIAGDTALRARLERDLNMKLDGTPLPEVRIDSVQNGIIIDYPVTVTVNLDGKPTPVTGRVQQPYRPRMIREAETIYKNQKTDRYMIAGAYEEKAREVMEDPKFREDIRKSLAGILSESAAKGLTEGAEDILRYATIIVTDRQIPKAAYNSYDGPSGKLHDLRIDLTEEGRRRLWQYSKNRVNGQILLIAEGLPIAAPRIRHELAQSQLTITQMADEVLLRDAVDAINRHGKGEGMKG
jgi:hypothetical protein